MAIQLAPSANRNAKLHIFYCFYFPFVFAKRNKTMGRNYEFVGIFILNQKHNFFYCVKRKCKKRRDEKAL